MKISVIGTGYVGLVSGTCFAEIGHEVTCIDIDENKVAMLKDGKSPIYEPGLNDLLDRNIASGRLHFSTGLESIKDSKSIFLAVGTPSGDDGSADLTYLFKAAEDVAENISDDAIIVIKSTVPVGTCNKVREIVQNKTNKRFHIVNNPEFLKEGSAIEDFMRPDRVVIGHQDDHAADAMAELYEPLVKQGNPIYMMSNLSAEMTKYAGNCFLATKISFINDVAKLCDIVGADINEVRQGISSDQRIGKHFLYPGPGYGGSCFPKDVKALIYTAKEHGTNLRIVEATEDVNADQKVYMFEKIKKHYGNDLKGKNFAFWGAAFKANTDDVRESPAIKMAECLIDAGATVSFFDPVAAENYLKVMGEKYSSSLKSFTNKYDCLNEADALVTMTEWREFSFPDFEEIKSRLKSPVIFDGRNLFKTSKVKELGFTYYAIGKRI
ncbi:UDP-glucose/GDP-mannose dehydrogenase family protein [Bacteriovorax sp. DB6_IX]|uniref:UDP-glucose dehydrogenase family protein n=1 Tax=Bacteriovorax sp. DB6_IX TaxID=1353530 RepID=UPI000389EAB4|nr:UDP-glucose/GDP-mannose dehydrogenase family protein [Bacteriovorax sp. DB6_IX]EQC52475.1 nucleotide sugar dehydrogenase [Bacteriovorax sp. DB6_IX]